MALAICFGFYYFFLRRAVTYQWNRIYLLWSYLLSFTVPALSFKFYPVYLTYLPSVAPVAEEVSTTWVAYDLIWTLIGSIYLAGVAVLLMRFLFNLYSITTLISKSEKKVGEGYTMITHDEENLTYSWFKYLFTDEQSPSQAVLEHEQVHIYESVSYTHLTLPTTPYV